MLNRSLLGATAIVGALSVLTIPAYAKAGPRSTPAQPSDTGQDQSTGTSTPAAASGQASDEGTADIVVTGSRIARREVETTSPIATVTSEQIANQGITNVQDLAQKLPQVGIPGLSKTNSNFVTTGNGIATINLRNLGTERTLVLVNGRRFVPGVAGTSIVDVNNIPADFIDRVEVVTGGASAVYGSDAVAGVVNFITKDRIEGIIARGQYGVSEQGDNVNYTASLTGGLRFGADGRGSIIGNVTYAKDKGLFSRDRAISAQDCLYICGPVSYSSFPAQGRFILQGSSPKILPGNNSTFTFNPDNSVVYGFPVGYGYNRNNDRRISTPVERYLAAGAAKYEFSEHLTAFVEGTYGRTQASTQIEAVPLAAGSGISNPDLALGYLPGNPFIPSSVAALIAARNSDGNPANDITSISFARRQNEVYTRSNRNKRDTFRVTAGLRGLIAGDWNYEVSAVYGQLRDHTQTEDVDLAKYANALDAVRDANGAIVCRSAAARAAGCVPINLFGYNSASPQASAYVRSALPRTDDVKNTEFVATANVSGTLVRLPYGDLKVSVGSEYRREASTDNWDALTNAGLNSGNQTPDTSGKFDVKEVFGEVAIPLLKDLPFVKSLSLQGAARYSDYSSIGNVFSWNVGGEWAPVSGFRLRGNYAVANRAPNISELYTAPSETFPGVTDPCNGVSATSGGGAYASACRAIPAIASAIANGGTFVYPLVALQGINGFDQGNPNLKQEKAKTLTLGGVITPGFMRGLTLTADYFDINLSNAIALLPRQTSIQQCLLTNATQYCSQVIRDPATGYILTVNAQSINAASLKTSGVDFNLIYTHGLGLAANDRLTLNVLYTLTTRYQTQSFSGSPNNSGLGNIEYGEVFRHKINANLNYSWGPFSLSYTGTYLSRMVNTPVAEFDPAGTYDFLVNSAGLTPEQATRAVSHNNIKARYYSDMQFRARAGAREQFEFFVGVDNLFNTKPPILEDGLYYGSITGTTTAADVYDPFGRRFYAGVQLKF